ncbi:hypothetical protein [Paraflavitalea speifideaquila]|uniref:alpha/beta hydrolase family protein n=1 Tax=Paraflavitalea speifideaquila TaxID=3076558 RepID=UPI0028EEE6F5|nr:hypothetical protein [Paraflavitalea speifideiaquila]
MTRLKKYPVIISFYGELSSYLYRYPEPLYPHHPGVFDRPAWWASHGYLVFTPDIYFREGQWGPSTVNTVEGAARYMRTLPYVDSTHLGACGHSNSGRFGTYLFTHSKSFAAMSIGEGAGYSNVISHSLSVDRENGSWLEWAEKGAYAGDGG